MKSTISLNKWPFSFLLFLLIVLFINYSKPNKLIHYINTLLTNNESKLKNRLKKNCPNIPYPLIHKKDVKMHTFRYERIIVVFLSNEQKKGKHTFLRQRRISSWVEGLKRSIFSGC